MIPLTPSDVLDLCDLGETSSPAGRAVLLLEAAEAGDAPGHPRDWPLGTVNAALLRLHALVLGQRLDLLADCPRCGSICESEIDCLAIANSAGSGPGPFSLALGETPVAFRLPTSADLAAAARDNGEPGHALARRIAVDCEVTEELAVALAEGVAEADPLARIELALRCPDCDARWSAPLYVIDVIWTELRSLANRLVLDVARLAQAFGWSEADILGMSARRRQRYLDLLPT